MPSRMVNFLLFIVVTYVSLMALMYGFQRKLMYLPDTNIASPEQYGLKGFSEHMIASADGTQIQIWFRKAEPTFPTILYFHGNASHLGDRAGIFSALASKGFGIVALSYRGYGKSAGSPSEEGLYEDARAAIEFLKTHASLGQIMLYGESLGTGIAVQMATEYDVAALALQAPYTSVAGRAAEMYFFLPVHLLIKDRFDSIHKIGKVKAPVLIFHGQNDAVIPVSHGKTLLEAANSPKQAFFMPGVEHNNFDSQIISEHVVDFAKRHQLIAP